MKNKIKLNEAIYIARAKGIKINKKIIASHLWADSSETTQQVNMTNLVNGKTQTIRVEWIEIICKLLECTPNFLFGYEE